MSFLRSWLFSSPGERGEKELTVPSVLRTKEHVIAMNVEGRMPTQEMELNPSWLIFRSSDDFQHESYMELLLINPDPFIIAYSLGVRYNILRCEQGYGILLPFQQKAIKIYICCAEDWEMPIDEMIAMSHKLLVEHLRVPENVRPVTELAAAEMAREIFTRTRRFNPAAVMYMKAPVILEKD